jgi:hypothetical protein
MLALNGKAPAGAAPPCEGQGSDNHDKPAVSAQANPTSQRTTGGRLQQMVRS